MGSGATVLVVDDSGINRMLLSRLLGSIGVRVLEACDGQEGLATFTKHRASIRFIFMDLVMPVLDGWQTTLRVRRLESSNGWRPPVPIVAYTSEDVEHGSPLWQRCLDSGMNDVVSKPGTKLNIVQMLHKYLPFLAAPAHDDGAAAAAGWAAQQRRSFEAAREQAARAPGSASPQAGGYDGPPRHSFEGGTEPVGWA